MKNANQYFSMDTLNGKKMIVAFQNTNGQWIVKNYLRNVCITRTLITDLDIVSIVKKYNNRGYFLAESRANDSRLIHALNSCK